MISRKIFDVGQSPSINQLSPIHNHYNFQLTNQQSQTLNNDDRIPGRFKQNQTGKKNERGTQEKNSFLLKSFDKYDNTQKVDDCQSREQYSKYKQIYSRQVSNHKSRSNSPAFNTNNHILPLSQTSSQLPQSSTIPSQYELLLQYELKRQKEKNEILQKRLSNKQDFIKQMKSIQQEITVAYAKCQQELNQTNTILYELKTNSAKQVRDYKEQIQEMRHQIVLLENDIKMMNNNQFSRKMSVDHQSANNNQNSLYYNDSFKKQIEAQKRYLKSKSTINLARHQSIGEIDPVSKISSVTKKLSLDSPHIVDLKQLRLGQNQNQNVSKDKYKIRQNDQQKNTVKNMIRSNTHSVLVTGDNNKKIVQNNIRAKKQMTPPNSQYSSISPNYQVNNNKISNPLNILKSLPELSQFQVEIIQNISKVSNFLQHFIDMCQKMMEIQLQQNKGPNNHDETEPKQQGKRNKSLEKQHLKTKLIHQLKRYWKWIKQVIRQWKDMKDQRKITKPKSNKQIFNINKNTKIQGDGEQFMETLGPQQIFPQD